MQLNGKTALVTGGTDGIGAELIRQLRAKGVTVITHGRNAERVTATPTAVPAAARPTAAPIRPAVRLMCGCTLTPSRRCRRGGGGSAHRPG